MRTDRTTDVRKGIAMNNVTFRRLACLLLSLLLLCSVSCKGTGQGGAATGADTAPGTEPPTGAPSAYTGTPTEPRTDPVTVPDTDPVTDSSTVPATEPLTEPDTDPVTEPVTDPQTEPGTEPTDEPDEPGNPIKNIIFMIPDGAGFGTYDLANALKSSFGTGVYGQKTPVTTDAITGRTVTGLYLDEFMIATADTSMATDYNGYATDSAAAGTALLCGCKTNYLMVGVDPAMRPRANLLELCRLEGKSTGFVTTKCLVDATPSDAAAHSLKRADQDGCAYQLDVSLQMLNSGIDVLLAYGSDGGYINTYGKVLHDDRAARHGYVVADSLAAMNAAVYDRKVTRLWSDFHTPHPLYYCDVDPMTDYQALHVPYDCDAVEGDLTLMDMAKAALELLSVNINDPDGFCLVIEGGAIDNAAETRLVREAVGEYLAFDEVFGYCVDWAKQRGDTIVIACPDHDSGGFYLPENRSEVLQGLSDGTIADGTVLPGAVTGHSPQNVPVWLYAPDEVRREILAELGLPEDVGARDVRRGRYYDGTQINEKYEIRNSDIAPAVVKAAGLMTFAEASDRLFVRANRYGSYDETTRTFTFENGERIVSGSSVWTDASGQVHPFAEGTAFWLTNHADYDVNVKAAKGTVPNLFYVPLQVLIDMGYRTN